jgi:hypothetical protein
MDSQGQTLSRERAQIAEKQSKPKIATHRESVGWVNKRDEEMTSASAPDACFAGHAVTARPIRGLKKTPAEEGALAERSRVKKTTASIRAHSRRSYSIPQQAKAVYTGKYVFCAEKTKKTPARWSL